MAVMDCEDDYDGEITLVRYCPFNDDCKGYWQEVDLDRALGDDAGNEEKVEAWIKEREAAGERFRWVPVSEVYGDDWD